MATAQELAVRDKKELVTSEEKSKRHGGDTLRQRPAV